MKLPSIYVPVGHTYTINAQDGQPVRYLCQERPRLSIDYNSFMRIPFAARENWWRDRACEGCAFCDKCNSALQCAAADRMDGKNVWFIKQDN